MPYLRLEIARVQAEVTTADRQLTNYNQQIAAVSRDREAARTALEAPRQRLASLNASVSQIPSVQAEVAAAERDLAIWNEQITVTDRDRNAVRGRVEASRRRLTELINASNQIGAAQAAVTAAEQQVAALTQSINQLRSNPPRRRPRPRKLEDQDWADPAYEAWLDRLSSLDQEREAVTTQLNANRNRVNELTALRNQIPQVQTDIATGDQQIAQLSARIDELTRNRNSVTPRLDASRNRLAELTTLSQQIPPLQAEIATQEQAIANLAARIDQLTRDRNVTQATADLVRTQLAQLNRISDSLDQAFEESQRADLEVLAADFTRRVETLQLQRQQTRDRLQTAHRHLIEIEQANAEAPRVQADLAASDRELADLNSRLDPLTRSRDAAQAKATATRRREAELVTASQQIPATQAQLNAANQEIEAKNQALASIDRSIESLERRRDRIGPHNEQALEELANQLGDLYEQRRSVEQERSQAIAHRQSAQTRLNELNNLQAQIPGVQAEAIAAEQEVANFNSQIQSLSQTRETVRNRVDTLRQRFNQLTTLINQLAQVQSEGAAARRTVTELESQIEEWSQARDAATAKLLGFSPRTGADTPIALLPVRLETRFVTRGGRPELLIRIYPDDLHIDSHELELTEDEVTWGQFFWEQSWRAGNHKTQKQQLWAQLVERFGDERATWIVRSLQPLNPSDRPSTAIGIDAPLEPPPQFPEVARRSQVWNRAPQTQALPDRWVAVGYQAGQRVFTVWGNPVPLVLATGPDPEADPDTLETTELQVDAGMRWLVDFEAAVQAGMGFRIALTPEQFRAGFDQLLVVGVKSASEPSSGAQILESLLQAHRYTDGLAFVPQGTPTNNTDIRSGYSSQSVNIEHSYGLISNADRIQPGDGSDGDRTAQALGLPTQIFGNVDQANGQEQQDAQHMNTVLWAATWGYFLEQLLTEATENPTQPALPLLTDEAIAAGRCHFIDFVRARGPLPALRVGNQPYGILPVTSCDRWQAQPSQPDLVLFQVDRAAGGNRGNYRLGWNLDQSGQVTAGWKEPRPLPATLSPEHQGAGMAIADLNQNGRSDLVVFYIDNPAGDNRGYYRIGYDLDLTGNVTGGWSAAKPIPGWFGWENQGGDIAIADLNGDRQLDLLVLHLDNPGGENRAHYRIGWQLDLRGNVTGGWSEVRPIPGWFGEENQGAGVAIADLNGNGQPDLVVFHVDNPPGENRGYYRIGRNLDAAGNITAGWTDRIAVPGSFGVETQGVGIAIADLNGNGQADLVIFHIQKESDRKQGYYRIGWNLDVDGNVAGGWTDPIPVTSSFAGEQQGAGIAIANISNQDLLSFLQALRQVWRHSLSPTAPKPDFVSVLQQTAVSQQYQARSLVGSEAGRQLWADLGEAAGQQWWQAKEAEAIARLQAIGVNWKPRLSRVAYLPEAVTITSPLVEAGTAANDPPSYLSELLHTPYEVLQAEIQGQSEGEVRSQTLLYLLVRHALLLEYGAAAFHLLQNQGLANRGDRVEAELIDVEPNAPTPTLWRRLQQVIPDLTDNHSLGQYLDQLQDYSRPEVAALGEFRQSLAYLANRGRAILEPLLSETLDLCTHRLDAWMTSLATRRLAELRAETPQGLVLGGYGWVENLRPAASENRRSDGYIQAPSLAHAATAAILRNGYLSHQGEDSGQALAIDLSSERVRLALWLMDGVRQGQPLAALLGYRFERGLHENHPTLQLDRFVQPFRKFAPLTVKTDDPALDEQIAQTQRRIATADQRIVDLTQQLQILQQQLRDAEAWAPETQRQLEERIAARDRRLAELQRLPIVIAARIATLQMQQRQVATETQQFWENWRADFRKRTPFLWPVVNTMSLPPSDANLDALKRLVPNFSDPRQDGTLLALQDRARQLEQSIAQARSEAETAKQQEPIERQAFESQIAQLTAQTEAARRQVEQRARALVDPQRELDQVKQEAAQARSLLNQLIYQERPLEAIAANNVVDGLTLLHRWQAGRANQQWNSSTIPFGQRQLPQPGTAEFQAVTAELAALADAVDAISDVVTAESVYHLVRGNPLRAGATLDAIAKGETPPTEIEVVRTPRSGIGLTHRVLVLFSGEATHPVHWPTSNSQIRAIAEPHLNAWAAQLLGNPAQVWCRVELREPHQESTVDALQIALQDLQLSPLDLLWMAGGSQEAQLMELEQRFIYHVRRSLPQLLSPQTELHCHFGRDLEWADTVLSVEEFLELTRTIRQLITGARAVDARDLALPETDSTAAIDLQELEQRASAVITRFQQAAAELPLTLPPLASPAPTSPTPTPTPSPSKPPLADPDPLPTFPRPRPLPIDEIPDRELPRTPPLPSPGTKPWPIEETPPIFVPSEPMAEFFVAPPNSDLDPIPVVLSLDSLRETLLQLATCGVPNCIPISASGETESDRQALWSQVQAIRPEVQRRLDQLSKLEAQFEAGSATSEELVAYHKQRLQTVLGTDFTILPRCLPANANELQQAFAASAQVQGHAPSQAPIAEVLPVTTWFQRASRVRDGVARMDTAFLYAESLGNGAELALQVGQLPYQAKDRWVGLPPTPEFPLTGGRLSLVAHLPQAFDTAQSVAGLLIDEWVEVVPNAAETTGVTFHFDQPGARAPQAVLLAVPPDRQQAWNLDTLTAIVQETFELAKLRTVDPDTLGQLGHFLPALYFAANPAGETAAIDFQPLVQPPQS